MSDEDKKGILDRAIQKATSRKLLVWVVSTGLLCLGDLNGDQWVAIALAYIGTQAVIDAASAWKHGPR
jgi:hypothetical protein